MPSLTSTKTATMLMSGGIDSAACGCLLQKQGFAVRGVFIDYGQAAVGPERRAVAALAAHLGMPLDVLRVSGAAPFSSGELTGRNAFLMLAALFLTRQRTGLLAIGVHAGTPYYDCSPPFIASMTRLVSDQTDGQITVVAPFLTWQKGDVLQYFVSVGLPIELAYSCEAGAEPPCGTCASCRDRQALGR